MIWETEPREPLPHLFQALDFVVQVLDRVVYVHVSRRIYPNLKLALSACSGVRGSGKRLRGNTEYSIKAKSAHRQLSGS